MTRLALYLFGSPYIERDGTTITLDTRKALALGAYLAVTGKRQSRDTLAALLWPDYDQSRARAALRRTLSTLNRALDSKGLDIDRESIGLAFKTCTWIDVVEFQYALATYRTHHHAPSELCPLCLELLTQAVTLYRDDFMAGFNLHDSPNFDDWQFLQTDALRREQAHALERLTSYHSAQADFETAIAYARRWLALDRLHEPAHRTLIQLYARTDQRAMSIQQYLECKRILEQELGVEPLETTRQLYETIKSNLFSTQVSPIVHPTGISTRTRIQHFSPAGISSTALSSTGYHHSLVGRDNEWSRLLQVYEQARTRGQVIVIEGEAGSGKTCISDEFLKYAITRGARTLTVRCYEGERKLAYGPIITALRAALERQEDWHWQEHVAARWLNEATRLLPELEPLRFDPLPDLNYPTAATHFFEGIQHILLTACRSTSSQPGVILFDDIHLADEATHALLSFLTSRLHEHAVCLVFTQRSPAYTSQQTRSRETRQINALTRIPLPRLDQTESRQLIHEQLSAPPAQALIERLIDEAEGLPGLLLDYLAAFTKGELAVEDDTWALPETVRYRLSSRLNALENTPRQILNAAAVIGSTFDFDTLCVVSGYSEEESVIALEELLNQGFIREQQSTEDTLSYLSDMYGRLLLYEFSSDKLRTLLIEEMSKARRRLLHRRIARTLLTHKRGNHDASRFIAVNASNTKKEEAREDALCRVADSVPHDIGHLLSIEHILLFPRLRKKGGFLSPG